MSHMPFGTPYFVSGPALYYEVDHFTRDLRTGHALHFHDCYEVCIHIRGKQQLYFNQQVYDLQPMDVFIISPYHIHGLIGEIAGDKHERVTIRLSAAALEKLEQGITSLQTVLENIVRRDPHLHLEPADWHNISHLLPAIRPNTADQHTADKLISAGALRIILGILYRISRQASEPPPDSQRTDRQLSAVSDYIAAHFTEDCTLEGLSERFNISKYHLSHRFADAFGVSVYQYVLMCRIALAKKLILDGESLQLVSEQCGFNDYSNFLRVFSRQTGMPPSKWKENARSQIR